MKAKLKKLNSSIEGFIKKIKTHRHHKLILGITAMFCLFLVVILPIYNVYSVEETPYSQQVTREVLGNESYGSVVKEGPYGNSTSPVKVAYIVGQHPREHYAHEAVVENVKEQSKSLKNCYYLYYINVTSNTHDYSIGRMNGQILANKYVVPDVASENFYFAVDVHGTDGEYSKRVFLFTPIERGASLDIANKLTKLVDGVPYFNAPNPSSTEYTTIPLINKGVPAIVYESFTGQSYNFIKEENKEFILGVDNLNLKPNPCY